LIKEANEICELESLPLNEICESMPLNVHEIHSLFI